MITIIVVLKKNNAEKIIPQKQSHSVLKEQNEY